MADRSGSLVYARLPCRPGIRRAHRPAGSRRVPRRAAPATAPGKASPCSSSTSTTSSSSTTASATRPATAADPGRASGCRTAVRDTDLVARLGGDEFTVLCCGARRTGAGDDRPPGASAARCARRSTSPASAATSASASAAASPRAGEADPDALLRDADSAMYQAKERGQGPRRALQRRDPRPRCCAGSSSSSGCARRSSTTSSEVALPAAGDLATGRARGRRGARCAGRRPRPAEFIPLAEETGLIGPLGAWVLGTRDRDLAAWHAQGLTPLTVTVNVSTRQLEDPDFPRRRRRARRRRPRARATCAWS